MARSGAFGLAVALLSASCKVVPVPDVCAEGLAAGKDAGAADAGDAGSGDAGSGDAGAADAGIHDGGSYCSGCKLPASCGSVQSASVTGPAGLAASAVHPGAYYLQNGSPDVPRFFAMDETGADLGTYTVSGAASFDWEDVAVGPCPGGSCVFLADIGDASLVRPAYAVYRVTEPSVLAGGSATVTADAFPFVYPDGPHDAATLLVHPVTGVITILTRDRAGTGTLAFELPAALPGQGVTATPRGSVEVGLGVAVTGGLVRADGNAVLLRTTAGALFYAGAPADAGKAPVTLPLAGKPCTMTVANETDGEAIAWMRSGGGFLTLDRSASASLHYVFCPGP